MHHSSLLRAPMGVLLTFALATPGIVLAYGEEDAIRDCENRIRSEYNLTDLRDAHAMQLDGEKHFKVEGKAKVDGDKHPWTCEVKNRHVTTADYSGPKPKGMGTAEKLAIGTAAAVAIGVAASQANKHQDDGEMEQPQRHSGHGGAAALQDLVGAKASSGEMEMEDRGYEYASGSKGGGSSYTNWVKGSHCVTIRTENGRYRSIVDVTMLDCE
ncbi:hypothetical protein [Thiocystis violascens]|uniref:Uncharacterized protein n=1 Tax=Thiocystis violascens (strain ATCC 17096 / DSM 198 / 6111) TaxID=765911 RepID=I3YG43_THIV6|nr:hypothetical protein [Thiocystis violascens]AFL75961.1 hypothetical protein Thivi_4142 [Thiocystis violascens DSM 198]